MFGMGEFWWLGPEALKGVRVLVAECSAMVVFDQEIVYQGYYSWAYSRPE